MQHAFPHEVTLSRIARLEIADSGIGDEQRSWTCPT